jgi:hypothetical protein
MSPDIGENTDIGVGNNPDDVPLWGVSASLEPSTKA